MPSLAQSIELGGDVLGDRRHVCALVDGWDEWYALLMPFILDGFENRDRAYHIVDPKRRAEHLERLAANGVDVAGASGTRQLEVATWSDMYLHGGRFSRTAQLGRIRKILGEGRSLGYPVTRLIGVMDWASADADHDDLVRYESRLDQLLREQSSVVVCTYDLNSHSARTIAEIIGAHHGVLIRGVLKGSSGVTRSSARDRLITAASDLFAERGIQATGVDAVIAAAGVAKATFYRHFPSKDDLVVAWLLAPGTRWVDDVLVRVKDRETDPEARIPLFFDLVADWLEGAEFRGCPYLNTAAEITGPTHAALPIIREYLQVVEDHLADMLADAGYRETRTLAAQLQTLTAGSISLAVARRVVDPVLTARDAALSLLATAERS
jgi:AcrR family transcriptional regulator